MSHADLFRNLLLMAAVDGRMSESELRLLSHRAAEWGITGRRNFKIDQAGIIYFNEEENSSDWSRELGG